MIFLLSPAGFLAGLIELQLSDSACSTRCEMTIKTNSLLKLMYVAVLLNRLLLFVSLLREKTYSFHLQSS